ncbi:snRNA-activating protein complex subunit 2 [Syngnathoides biaculeatus]|uniref:snRNA-activating protein complex subunit 2 n=1 Tax=Syngnathoides biaculeatus TaxID=300417 RepID=UPI002ADE30C5|nr:snRNA-activating protein complex subunit 2 [Syngnathoides biaculeatus]
MKPPPRTRNKPVRNAQAPEPKGACAWSRKEQKMLLQALGRQSTSCDGGSFAKVDYGLLHKALPSRSVSEIQSTVERLQNKVIACATFQLKSRMAAEKKAAAPVQSWAALARAVSGDSDEPLSKAFSQMWTVASTEPDVLKHRHPPRPDDGAAGGSAADSAVDFERIYIYLSGGHKPEAGKRELTAMERAVLLDLVMSLPEELAFLPCQSLRRHLTQVYQNFSEARDSENAQKVLTELSERRRGGDRPAGDAGQPAGSGGPAWTGLCPPLNPFLIPLELLKRR